MPSSDPVTIPKVLKLVEVLQPKTIIDIGCGNGRYGFLFRELLDFNQGRMKKEEWETWISGVEIEPSYITDIHRFVYNHIYQENWLNMNHLKVHDLIFMGDVLEHFAQGDWQRALMKARLLSNVTIVVSPNWQGSSAQGAWGGNEYERHRVELFPEVVGGRCLFANSKSFICVFENNGSRIFEERDILL